MTTLQKVVSTTEALETRHWWDGEIVEPPLKSVLLLHCRNEHNPTEIPTQDTSCFLGFSFVLFFYT